MAVVEVEVEVAVVAVVEVVEEVEVEVAVVEVVEEVEVVLGQRPWEDCSVEECLNYDQSEVCFPLTVGSAMVDFY